MVAKRFRGRFSRGKVLTAIVVVGFSLTLTWWLLSLGTRGVELAGVLAIPVGVLGILATIWGVLRAERPAVADSDALLSEACKIAGEVRKNEIATLNNLLADTGFAKPAELSFAQRRYWRTDGGAEEGSSSNIRSYFGQLRHGRLVVTGAAGGGKTVLAIQLTRDLASEAADVADRRDQPHPGGAADSVPGRPRLTPRVVVPVRLNASSIDLGTDVVGRVTPRSDQLARRFDTLLTEHLVSVHDVRKEVAETLVTDGWILPVVDGLDEMDRPGVGTPRMSMLLEAINHPTSRGREGLRPIVLTCRTERYAAQAEVAQRSATVEIAQDATVIELQRMGGSAVRDYLTRRFEDPSARGRVEPRWEPVITRFETNIPDDPLVIALQSPLRLYLAITAYRDARSNPQELLSFESDAQLDDYLFTGLVPAVIRMSRARYSPEDVTEWLVTLASLLRRVPVGSRTDAPERIADSRQRVEQFSVTGILLSDLWLIVGDAARRRGATLAAIPFGLTVSAVFFLLTTPVESVDIGVTVAGAIFSAVVGLILAWILRRVASRRYLGLYTVNLASIFSARRAPRVEDAVWLSVNLAVSVPLSQVLIAPLIAKAFPNFTIVSIQDAIVTGVCFASAVMIGSASDEPVNIRRPTEIAVQGAQHTFRPILLAMFIGVGVAAFSGQDSSPEQWRARLLIVLVCLAIGAWVSGMRWWPRYMAVTLILSRSGCLSRQPTAFLDWACNVGLMRVADGGALQFRHVELQDWLRRQSARR